MLLLNGKELSASYPELRTAVPNSYLPHHVTIFTGNTRWNYTGTKETAFEVWSGCRGQWKVLKSPFLSSWEQKVINLCNSFSSWTFSLKAMCKAGEHKTYMGYSLNKPHLCGLSKRKWEEQHLKLLEEPHTTAGRQLMTSMHFQQEDPNRNTPLQKVRAQHSNRPPRAQGQSQELS